MTAQPGAPGDVPVGSPFLRPQHVRWLTLALLAAMALYLGFALWSGWAQVRLALARVGWLGVLTVLLLSQVNYGLRFVRWQGYLYRLGHRLHWGVSLQIYLAGFALTATPGKAGESLRGLLLRPYGVPYTDSIAAFFSERLSDLMAIVVLALFGLNLHALLQPLLVAGVVAVLTSLLLLSQNRLLDRVLRSTGQRPQKLFRGLHQAGRMVEQARRCHGWRQLVCASLLSLVAWFAEALALYWIVDWMGTGLSLQQAIFIYAAAMLAGAFSFMPGGLGGAEAVMVMLLVWAGMPMPEAVAATVLSRITTLWFAVWLGVVFLWRVSRTRAPA